jgi:hypothetical protein
MVEVNAYDQLMVGVTSTSRVEVTCIPGGSRTKKASHLVQAANEEDGLE